MNPLSSKYPPNQVASDIKLNHQIKDKLLYKNRYIKLGVGIAAVTTVILTSQFFYNYLFPLNSEHNNTSLTIYENFRIDKLNPHIPKTMRDVFTKNLSLRRIPILKDVTIDQALPRYFTIENWITSNINLKEMRKELPAIENLKFHLESRNLEAFCAIFNNPFTNLTATFKNKLLNISIKQFEKEKSIDFAKFLLENGSKPNTTTGSFIFNKTKPLDFDCEKRNSQDFSKVCRHNEFIYEVTSEGYHPLIEAYKKMSPELFQLLIDFGADPTQLLPSTNMSVIQYILMNMLQRIKLAKSNLDREEKLCPTFLKICQSAFHFQTHHSINPQKTAQNLERYFIFFNRLRAEGLCEQTFLEYLGYDRQWKTTVAVKFEAFVKQMSHLLSLATNNYVVTPLIRNLRFVASKVTQTISEWFENVLSEQSEMTEKKALAILGLKNPTRKPEIKKACRALKCKFHPDISKNNQSVLEFYKVTKACDFLLVKKDI